MRYYKQKHGLYKILNSYLDLAYNPKAGLCHITENITNFHCHSHVRANPFDDSYELQG